MEKRRATGDFALDDDDARAIIQLLKEPSAEAVVVPWTPPKKRKSRAKAAVSGRGAEDYTTMRVAQGAIVESGQIVTGIDATGNLVGFASQAAQESEPVVGADEESE